MHSHFQNVFSAVVTSFVNKSVFELRSHVMSLFTISDYSWIEAKGVESTFSTIGGLVLICSAFTIPMYFYGKR